MDLDLGLLTLIYRFRSLPIFDDPKFHIQDMISWVIGNSPDIDLADISWSWTAGPSVRIGPVRGPVFTEIFADILVSCLLTDFWF